MAASFFSLEPNDTKPPDRKSTLKPYVEIREAFSTARRELLRMQGPITVKAILKLEKSRKYAHSPASAAKRG